MKFITAFAVSTIILLSTSVHSHDELTTKPAAWTLDAQNTRVNFITIKKGNIAESHIFNDVSGSITAGKASITIKPDSVDSKVPIRNERMREFLFETQVYPSIEITANVKDVIGQLDAGNSSLITIPATLSMHGISKELTLDLRVSKLNNDTLLVASVEPVLVRAADYNMLDGITKLSSLVNKLPIAETVPVNFSLQLNKN